MIQTIKIYQPKKQKWKCFILGQELVIRSKRLETISTTFTINLSSIKIVSYLIWIDNLEDANTAYYEQYKKKKIFIYLVMKPTRSFCYITDQIRV